MKQKMFKGIAWGIFFGGIDVIPMIFQKLSWDANLSAFAHWIIVGFVISISNLQLKGVWKGLVLAWILLIPVAILIAWQEPFTLVPVLIMTTILGSLLGWVIERK